MRHSRSKDMGVARQLNFDAQKEEVKTLIHSPRSLTTPVGSRVVLRSIGRPRLLRLRPLACGHRAAHPESAGCQAHVPSQEHPMDVKLEQEGENGAFFSVLSNVVGSATDESSRRAAHYDSGITETDVLERRLEKEYLRGSKGVIVDGVMTGYQYLEKAEALKKCNYRMQCYRSSGVLDPITVSYHVRMCVEPGDIDSATGENETDINRVGDKVFLERAGDRLKRVYQQCIIKAMAQMTLAFHTKPVWPLLAKFSANVIVIYGFYLQMVENPKGTDTFEDRLAAVVNDASMHFTLPRTSVAPILTKGLLTPQEIAYTYAAWQFTFHFMHRLPESFVLVSKSLRVGTHRRLRVLSSCVQYEAEHVHGVADSGPQSELGGYSQGHLNLVSYTLLVKRRRWTPMVPCPDCASPLWPSKRSTLSTPCKSMVSEQALQIFMFHVFNKHVKKTKVIANDKVALTFRLDGALLSKTAFPDEPFAIIYVVGSEFRGFHVRLLVVEFAWCAPRMSRFT
ncbi:hypothetical protein PHYBOEH_006481 [Phytophthora boehmeriae]|uniref:NAD-specific glutamate dehydrogenase second domain-containing protein n=1 Tax=Phytophthora boehmeriae TaxID=109152 RepID=A0A8T1WJ21_9STRA|nr:hypothetical protein PHYBOEH_006481 [Phytophthora boehmeriae]